MRTAMPTARGRIVFHDDQEYMAPAQLRGSETTVLPMVKSTMPIQSGRLALVRKEASIGRRSRKKKARRKLALVMGRWTGCSPCEQKAKEPQKSTERGGRATHSTRSSASSRIR